MHVLLHDRPVVVSLDAVRVSFLANLAHFAFQLGDCVRGFALLFLAPLAEACRGSGVALPFLVRFSRCRLHVHGDLRGALIGVIRHELHAILNTAGRGSIGTFTPDANVRRHLGADGWKLCG